MLTLVLLPGMDGTGNLFDPFISALGCDIKTLVIRYPHSQPLGYPDLEIWIRQTLPKDKPFVLLGESFSSPLAISIAASPPQGLLALILCCSFACNPYPLLRFLSPYLSFFPVKYAPQSILEYFLLGKHATPSLYKALSQSLNQVTHDTLVARMRAVLHVNVTDKLSHIAIPVLYLHALHDRIIPHRAFTHIANRLPNMQSVEFKSPHFLLQTHPQEAANSIMSFLQTHAIQI